MAWGEATRWLAGQVNQPRYQELLDDARRAPEVNRSRAKVVHPQDMPWEMAPQGILKHLLNEGMHTRMDTVDAYLQVIPPGSRSGRHRHLAEECCYVLEGRGYDLHEDCDVEIGDQYSWEPCGTVQRFEWEAGDVIYIPPNTIHQHVNADDDAPARLVSATNRVYEKCGLNDLEQFEDAPEYEPGLSLDADSVRRYLRPAAMPHEGQVNR